MVNAFLTVLVVANVLPILPVVLRFTDDVAPHQRRRTLIQAVLLGNGVALTMVAGGDLLLLATHIEVLDLRIAGGVVLLVFATFDLLFSREQRKQPLARIIDDPGAPALIPLAVPVLVGPAVLATVVVVASDHGRVAALVAVLGNAAINLIILALAEPIYQRLGMGVSRALGKVMGLILAALAVSMIRTGVTQALAQSGA